MQACFAGIRLVAAGALKARSLGAVAVNIRKTGTYANRLIDIIFFLLRIGSRSKLQGVRG